MLRECERCNREVYAPDNGVYLDTEPTDDEWFLMPLQTSVVAAAGGRQPPGIAHFALHEHQPEDSQ